MNSPRNRLQELVCNAGCFLLALGKGQLWKLPFFAHHALRALV